MRALGPGSVSSFLKVILDVVYFALWVGVAALALLALAALLLSFNPTLLGDALRIEGGHGESIAPPLLAGGIAFGALYLGIVLVVVERLRKVFGSLTGGDPFQPDNVRRLQVIGAALAALELSRYLFWGATALFMPHAQHDDQGVSLTAWFSVLVVFVLAEVFREGARLRQDAELTI